MNNIRSETSVAIAPVEANQRPGTTRERQGRMWVIGSFIVCPCHLPITLAILSTLFGGSVLGAAIRQYPLIAAAILTLAWGAGTWRGIKLLGNVRNGVCEIHSLEAAHP
jgi:hypothetical protein